VLTLISAQSRQKTGIGCVYVAVGQKSTAISAVLATLKERGSREDAVVVASGASDSPLLQFITPTASIATAEWLARVCGRGIVAVYDDLTMQAAAYSELSLLMRRCPGRDGYPADLFYRHAQLLERAGNWKNYTGSVTAIPVVEIENGDLSSYLATNVVSITDGQAVLLKELFNQNIKPALDTGISVSRLGASVQPPAMRKISSILKVQLAQAKSAGRVSKITSDVDPQTKKLITRGKLLTEGLKQNRDEAYSPAQMVATLYTLCMGAFDPLASDDAYSAIRQLNGNPTVLETIQYALDNDRKLTPEEEQIVLDTAKQIAEAMA
jgi:F-type H+-transporting ATPase subunit alpha